MTDLSVGWGVVSERRAMWVIWLDGQNKKMEEGEASQELAEGIAINSMDIDHWDNLGAVQK
jgi:hypothetical protein